MSGAPVNGGTASSRSTGHTAATPHTTYAAAGVDLEAGDRAVRLMSADVASTKRPEVVGGIGGFAGLFDASALRSMRRPLLASSTDGVGTKVAIAQRLGVHDTIGFDLVGMVIDDLVVCGAEPLFMTDYIACGKVVPERVAAIVRGIAAACVEAGCALIGGETAEHPGLLGPDEYDLAGAATGVVEADELLGPERVRAGDAVVAIASSGLHANGYSLVRHVILDRAGWSLGRFVDELDRTIGEELLEPTRLYTRQCLQLARTYDVHAIAHVTGGGIAANVARVIPAGVTARIDRTTWAPPSIFGLIGAIGGVAQDELERTLNMGVGMVAVVAAADADRAVTLLAGAGRPAWIAGSIAATDDATAAGSAELVGAYS